MDTARSPTAGQLTLVVSSRLMAPRTGLLILAHLSPPAEKPRESKRRILGEILVEMRISERQTPENPPIGASSE